MFLQTTHIFTSLCVIGYVYIFTLHVYNLGFISGGGDPQDDFQLCVLRRNIVFKAKT